MLLPVATQAAPRQWLAERGRRLVTRYQGVRPWLQGAADDTEAERAGERGAQPTEMTGQREGIE